MLEAYSLNATVTPLAPIPFNSASLVKGCTAVLASPTTIELNKRGVYAVTFNGSCASPVTLQVISTLAATLADANITVTKVC